MKEYKNKNVVGAGGGKGSGGTIAPDTLASNSQVRVLFAVGEGPIGGLWTGDAKSILFNTTPYQNADGTFNFQTQNGSSAAPATFVIENGTATQPNIPGFSAVENYYAVNVEVFNGSPINITTSGANIDAVRVDIQIPQLWTADSKGNVNGTSVAYHFQTKLATGSTWTTVLSDTVTAKASSSTTISYLVPAPGTSSPTWQVRVVRDTPNDAGTTLADLTYVAGYTEIQYVQENYANTAVIGVSLDAQALGQSIPTISFNLYGRLIRVPDNYNPVTRAYTGIWDGSFSSTLQYTNNPAWILLDMITDSRAGLGLADSMIDKFSFYNAAQYCDAGIIYTTGGTYVSGGVSDGAGGYEPRFTFNGVLDKRVNSWDALNQVAAVMHGRLVTTGQLIKLVLDSPGTPVALITNSNVINDGDTDFVYMTPSATTAFTACDVTFNDPSYNYLERDVLYQDTTTTKPYLVTNMNGFGITSEGQARRLAKWLVDTSLYSNLMCSFKVSYEFADLEPFDIIKVMDTNVAGQQLEARIVSIAGTTVTLDRTLTIGSGTWTMDAVGADGVSIETVTLTSSGTSNSFTFSGSLTGAKNSTAILTGSVGPQYFRVMSIKETTPSVYDVNCIQYDVNKYARIEGGITIPTSPFFSQPSLLTVSPVSNFVFKQVSAISPDGTISRTLDVSWSPVATDYVVRYGITWQVNSGAVTDLGNNNLQPSCTIPMTADGVYNVYVVAINSFGKQSASATGSYTAVLSSPVTSSALPAPVNLQTIAGSTTSWSGPDLNIQWSPGTNTSSAVLKDYTVKFSHAGSGINFKTFNQTQTTYTYSFSVNSADNGGTPERDIIVSVQERDTNNMVSTADIQTFNNSAPAVPTNIAANGLTNAIILTWDPTTSVNVIEGYLVWASQTNGFTPNATNLVYNGLASTFTLANLTKNSTWYFKVAAFDIFGPSATGAGLNVSSQYSATAASTVGIPSGSSLPGTGTEGDLFYDTTDGQLYRYHSGAWTVAVPAVNVTGQLTAAQIASVNAASVAGTLTAAQIASIAATQVTGQITTTQIANSGITTPKIAAGAVTSSTIAANTITAGNIASATITGTQIAAATITGSNLVAGTITAGNIASNTITSSQIAAGAITGTNIAANTITSGNIAANTITAGNILSSTITSSQIAAGTITGTNIAAGTISSSNIAAKDGVQNRWWGG